MLTLSQINRFVSTHNISADNDIFSILSQMQLEYKENNSKRLAKNISHTPSATKVESSTQDLLDLFNS